MLNFKDFKKKQIILIIATKGEKLSFRNDNVIVKNSVNQIIHQSSCWKLFSIFIVGNVSISSGLILRAKKFSFSIVLMSINLRQYSIFGFLCEGNTLLRHKQYTLCKKDSLNIAKHIINNKIKNQISLLNKQRNKDADLKNSINLLKNYSGKVLFVNSIDELMGYEGISAKVYFKEVFNNSIWNSRKPRIKFDYINTCLDNM